MLLKNVETSVWCICSPSDLCIGSEAVEAVVKTFGGTFAFAGLGCNSNMM